LTIFPLTFAACVGCQRSVDYRDGNAELRQILAHSQSDELEQTLQKVSRVLNLVYAERLLEYLPNWIAFHALLMHGGNAYPNYRDGKTANENLDRIFAVIQRSDTQADRAFILRSGLPYPRQSGPYFMQEHHPDQFLLYFGLAGGTLDAPLTIDDKEYAFQNVLERSLLEARTTSELAFTVSAYAKFLEPGRTWQNKFGETMTLAMLLEKLLDTPERTCYGTHRLGALANVYARKEFLEDRAIARLWSELERQVFEALVMLKQSQRPDGGFELPEMTFGSPTQEHYDIYYTGHSLEWITFLGEDYCRNDWVVRAVDFLAGITSATYRQTYRNVESVQIPNTHFDFGGLSHAVSALKRWHDQVHENRERSAAE